MRNQSIYVKAATRFAIGGVLLCLPSAVPGQTRSEPYTFFKQCIGLKDGQIANIEHGRAVTKALTTSSPSEVAVFGAIYVDASPEAYLKSAKNLETLRSLPSYLGIRRFSEPPQLSDFEGFVLEDADIKDLRSCKPGKCELQLPTHSMDEFQKSVDWSAPDVTAQVNGLAQKMALEELLTYQSMATEAWASITTKKIRFMSSNNSRPC
jgi:hypothetical protein